MRALQTEHHVTTIHIIRQEQEVPVSAHQGIISVQVQILAFQMGLHAAQRHSSQRQEDAEAEHIGAHHQIVVYQLHSHVELRLSNRHQLPIIVDNVRQCRGPSACRRRLGIKILYVMAECAINMEAV